MFSSDCLSSRQRIVQAVVIQATPDAVGGEAFHEVNNRAVLRAVRTRCSTLKLCLKSGLVCAWMLSCLRNLLLTRQTGGKSSIFHLDELIRLTVWSCCSSNALTASQKSSLSGFWASQHESLMTPKSRMQKKLNWKLSTFPADYSENFFLVFISPSRMNYYRNLNLQQDSVIAWQMQA